VADSLTSAPEEYEELVREACRALERALDPGGRPRGGAFDLLVADALVTWAAEAALERRGGEARLEELVRSLAG
jgi:hypothetical protein